LEATEEMKARTRRSRVGLLVACVVTIGCGSTMSRNELTPDAYAKARSQRGVVLLGANWGRAWGYCGFENVQLRSFAFDRVPVQKDGDESPADLALEGPPRLLAKPMPVDYAFFLEPGEYALTAFHINAAKSVNDYGAFRAGRTKLMQDGKSAAGSFRIGADEIVYIGHFAPECPKRGEPIIWRYYLKDAAAFREYLAKMKEKYPFLDMETAQFRLFQTTTMGRDHQLQ
jgi:hypothetical protein